MADQPTYTRYQIVNEVWMNIANVPGLQGLLGASHVRDAIADHIDKVLKAKENG